MTPEQIAEVHRRYDLFLAKLGMRFSVPMGEVKDILQSAAPLPQAAGGEGSARVLPAIPSPETADQAGGFDSRSLTEIVVKRGFESHPAEEAKGGPAGTGRSDGGESPAAEGPAVPSAPVSTRAPRTGLTQRVLDAHREHPTMTIPDLARHLSCEDNAVRNVVKRHRLDVPKGRPGRRGEATQEPPAVAPADPPGAEDAPRKDASTAAPETTADVSPPAGEVEPSPAPKSPREGTLTARVLALHRLHPDYTAKQARAELGITKGGLAGTSFHLGIKWASERTKPVVDREFKSTAELQAHYADVKKRLGGSP